MHGLMREGRREPVLYSTLSMCIKRFGPKYLDQFERKLNAATTAYLRTHGRDIKNSYTNLITWRNDFAHAGKINATSTYAEAMQAYVDGKEVIRCLAETMVR